VLIVKGFLMQSTLLLWESRWPMGSQHLPHVEFLGLQLFRLRHNSQAVGNTVHKVEVRDDDHYIEDVLIGKAC